MLIYIRIRGRLNKRDTSKLSQRSSVQDTPYLVEGNLYDDKEEHMAQRTIGIIGAVVIAVVFSFAQTAWAKDSLIMGVHPYKSAKELHAKFKPIADAISKKIGKPVEFQVGRDYDDAVKKVGTGKFDFAFLGPTLYIKARDEYKVIPLAMIENKGKASFQGVIIVQKGSSISSLKDLKGKRFAFGSRGSTLSHVAPLYMLLDAGVKLEQLQLYKFVGSHDNVAQAVATKTFDAGGLMPDVAKKHMDRGLKVIAQSPELPEHVFVATKTMDAATVEYIQSALITLDPALQKKIKGSLTGMQKFEDKDFDVLRKIMKKVEKEMKK
jgi:phosphonate transport system substrate-binding protein